MRRENWSDHIHLLTNSQGARRLYKLAKNEIKNPPVVQSPVKKKQGTKCRMARLLHGKELENAAGFGLADAASFFCSLYSH